MHVELLMLLEDQIVIEKQSSQTEEFSCMTIKSRFAKHQAFLKNMLSIF